MNVKFHYVEKESGAKGFVIDVTLPRSARFDIFDEEAGVEVSGKNGMVTSHYRIGVEDPKQFVRMLNKLWITQCNRRGPQLPNG